MSVIIVPPLEARVAFEDLLHYVLPYVPSCPDQTAVFHLREATIEFCQKTTAWRSPQGDIVTAEGVTEYEFVLDAGETVLKLLSVALDGQDVNIVDPELGAQLDLREATGPYAYGMLDTFRISPEPAPDLILSTFSALGPTPEAMKLPKQLVDRFARVLADGAKASLLSMASADWYKPVEAERCYDRFQSRISSIARAAQRGHAKPRRDPSARFY